jgi:O-antigen/teichoic acid export membrane protein
LFCALTISVGLLAVFYGGISLVDVSSLFRIGDMDRHTVDFCLVVITLPVLGIVSALVLQSLYRAHGDFSRGECIFALFNVIQIGAVASSLMLHQPPWVIALCYAGGQTLFSFGVLADVLVRYRDVKLGLRVPGRGEWVAIMSRSLLFFTQPLSLALIQNATVMLFGILGASPQTVVSYTVFRIFTGLTRQSAYQFAVGGGIEMARQCAREDYAACRRLYGQTGRIVACLAGLLGGLSIPASRPFVAFWTHGAVSEHYPLLLCFLGGIFLAAPGQASTMLLRYANVPRPLAVGWLGQSLGGLLLCVVFFPYLGGTGVALGQSVAEFVAIGVWLPWVVQSRFGFRADLHLASSYGIGAIAFAVSLAAGTLAFAGQPLRVADLLLGAVGWGVMTAPVALFLILPPAGRGLLFARARRALAGIGVLPLR